MPTENAGLAQLTATVTESFAGASSPRTRIVMQSLVRHLHAFIEDVDADRGRVGVCDRLPDPDRAAL